MSCKVLIVTAVPFLLSVLMLNTFLTLFWSQAESIDKSLSGTKTRYSVCVFVYTYSTTEHQKRTMPVIYITVVCWVIL